MLKWFIIGTLLYYAVFYGDTGIVWEHGLRVGKRAGTTGKQTDRENGNGDCLVGASRYRMGQMRTNGDILGHLSKGVDNASIFVPQSDENA